MSHDRIPRRLRRVRDTILRTLDELPGPIRDALSEGGVSIEILDEPPAEVGPDTFGTFGGATFYEQETPFANAPEPAVIELYLSAFADLASDPEELDREVRLTVIHEIGHFLGFDEDDLEDV